MRLQGTRDLESAWVWKHSLKSGFRAAESQESREIIENWAFPFIPPTPQTKTRLFLFGGHTNASKVDAISYLSST